MPRGRRFQLADVPLHVTQRGVDHARTFASADDHRLYLGLLQELAPDFDCEIHAYVLMTNHVHVLLTPRADGACSRLMKHLVQRYSQAINKRWQRSGPLWDGRFKSNPVDTATYALRCQRYIELNPVRARMVRNPAEYPWSSFRAHAFGIPAPFLTPLRAYQALAEDGEGRLLAYRALFDESPSDREIEAIREAINSGTPLGPESFLDRMYEQFGRQMKRRNRRRRQLAEAPLKKQAKAGLSPV